LGRFPNGEFILVNDFFYSKDKIAIFKRYKTKGGKIFGLKLKALGLATKIFIP
jgi:hypothetical protein